MKKIICSTLLSLLYCTISPDVNAQFLGMNTSIYQPRGEFNDNTDRNPVGVSFNYLYGIGQAKKFNVGAELGVAMYSNKFYAVVDDQNQSQIIAEEDCFWSVHLIAQYNLFETPITKLYAEGRLGGTTFFSSKIAQDEDSRYDNEFKFHGTSFNMGLGGGLKLNMSGVFHGNGMNHSRIWMDFAATYNGGTSTSYRNATENTKSLNAANYTSLTNHINYRIGVNYRFGTIRI